MDEISPATEAVQEQAETVEQPAKKPPGVLNDILKLILKILVIVLVFMLMFTFLFGTAKIAGNAMDPNIKEGDRIIYYRLDKNYVATNCVAFRVAGDTVDMTEDGLVINGALQSEPDPSKDTLPLDSRTSFPVKLKKGEVFLMGDNRPEAVDSRQFGPVQAKDTLGELMTVIRSEK